MSWTFELPIRLQKTKFLSFAQIDFLCAVRNISSYVQNQNDQNNLKRVADFPHCLDFVPFICHQISSPNRNRHIFGGSDLIRLDWHLSNLTRFWLFPIDQKDVHRHLREKQVTNVHNFQGENRNDVIFDQSLLIRSGQNGVNEILLFEKYKPKQTGEKDHS